MTDNETFRTTVGGMVDKLKDLTDKDDIVGLLQKINEEILKHEIKADQYTIYPIWVEAYYYKEKVFEDMSCHINNTEDIRGNVPDQFEFRKHKTGYGGVDLYLGKSNNYYLSFLIKLALIKKGNEEPKLYSQVQIKDEIIDYLENEKFKNKLNYHLEKIDLGTLLGDYANDAKLRRIVEEHFNSQNINACLKDRLINKVGEKTKLIFLPTTLDLDTNNLKVAKCKRVGLPDDENNENNSDDENNGYNNEKLAACYEIRERKNNPRSYNTLKEKIDLYVLREN